MARKKKIETVEYIFDVTKLGLKKDKYISQSEQYIEENIANSKISKEGSTIKISVPVSFSKKMLKLRLNKFIYNAGLKDDFRLISLVNEKGNGFQVMDR
ncbi:hypothetical protein NEF87_003635 [Candidatus Lokiarchaeum ossiferum]|uniref:Uncharacterized protein n=1 Tax=Candidatus Lokiarchaeum ossiferum TaxID=2951803 RepID=A0ABY6HUZ9_9ARCH|nr:hypothetical protein NEF87_003635 [Candidatus Lokiarchaeum sp. B-35]